MQPVRDIGLHGLTIPQRFGGMGCDCMALAEACET
jgi:alkylation response protein AidB-like acyl-CoA dehydrogenase